MAPAKFVVRTGRTGLFRFDLVGPNGKIIATSQAYQARASALRGRRVGSPTRRQHGLVDMAGTRVVDGEAKKSGGTQAAPLPASDVGGVVHEP